MGSLDLLLGGLATAMQPENLLFALVGSIIGTLIGILPGVGPVAGTALLLPVTFKMEATSAIIMLTSIYYGAMYGGTLTSVLVNVPGEAASAITCIDGHEMAKRGRAGSALAVSAIGSFVGGMVAIAGLVLLAGPLTRLALLFGPPEFFALMLVGLSLVIGLAGKSIALALASAVLGLLVAMVGIDPVMGAPRFTFGSINLMGGIDVVVVAMGLFGVGEILVALEREAATSVIATRLRELMPTREEARRSVAPIARGTAIGFLLGLVPGIGAVVPTIMSYVAERKLSATPEKFGTGMIEGVAGPETANNAYANAALVPLFTLGIPASPTIAVLLGAFMMNGLTPGPFLFKEKPDFVWGVIASLYVGNLILVVLNLPLVGIWVKLLKTPRSILFSLVLAFTVVGAFVTSNSVFDIGVLLAFGVVGYLFTKMGIPIAPMAFTVILGPLTENALRQALAMSGGELDVLARGWISTGLLVLAAVVLAWSVFAAVRRARP